MESLAIRETEMPAFCWMSLARILAASLGAM
jgi:hypothetical protein